MKKLALLLASLALAVLAGGCGGKGSSADPPTDFKVVASDASAIVTWTVDPELQYWIFWGPGDSITTTNWSTAGGSVAVNVVSPYTVTGLVNGQTYSFTINARKNGGPGGPGAPTQVAVPRLAGDNWAVGTPLGSARLNGVTSGLLSGGYAKVAVGEGGTIFSSLNAGEYAPATNPAAPAALDTACYTGGVLLAAGESGTVLLSTDATTWTAQTTGSQANLHGCVAGGPLGFIAVGAAGTILVSVSGSAWTTAPPPTTNDLYAVTYGSSTYLAVGANGTIVASTDGTVWTPADSGTSADLRGIAYALLSTTQPDGTITTTNVLVAVGPGGTVVTSNDGVAWTVQPPFTSEDLNSVVYGGQFVAVGSSGAIYTSPDGVTWQARTSGTASDLRAVTRTQSGYTAVGDAGANVSSF